jgi:hypothetical protein
MQLRYKCQLPYKRSWNLTKAFKFGVLNSEMGSEVGSVRKESNSRKMHGKVALN